tara:strand:- start:6082 stop:6357 length:276 start_codon:yes stop_codon:yes gene_type:complete
MGTRDRTEMLQMTSDIIGSKKSNELYINYDYLNLLLKNINKTCIEIKLLNVLSHFILNKNMDTINQKTNAKKRRISKEIETMRNLFEVQTI